MRLGKMICLLLTALLLMALLVACGEGNQVADTPAPEEPAVEETAEEAGEAAEEVVPEGDSDKIVIGWAMAYFDHPVYQLLMQGAEELVERYYADVVDLVFVDGKNDPVVQTSQLDTFIAQDVDVIILTAAVSDPMLPAISRVNEADIPLIIVDRRIMTQGQDVTWEAFVTWDMVLSGTLGAEQVIEATGGEGRVVVVEGTAGAGSTIDRGGAFYGLLEEYPGIEVIYRVDGDFNRTRGMEVTETILRRFPDPGDFDVIYYMNDEMALGGLQAIKAADRLGEFTIITVDGQREALDAIRAGYIDFGVLFRPDEQAVAIHIAVQLARGEEPDFDNIYYLGEPIEVTETDDGFVWVRPTCYKVDATNAHLPEFTGW